MTPSGCQAMGHRSSVAILDNMKAGLIHRFKNITPEGGIIEAVSWKIPDQVKPSEHQYKYRMVYVVNGERMVGFDNAHGKGDHWRIRGSGSLESGGQGHRNPLALDC